MSDDTISVVKWVSYDDESYPEGYGGLGGFFREGMRWEDYTDGMTGSATLYAEALRAAIIRDRVWQPGDWHQQSGCGKPVFSDGTCGGFSFRAWGDLMAAVWSTELDKDFCYMDFYYIDTPESPFSVEKEQP